MRHRGLGYAWLIAASGLASAAHAATTPVINFDDLQNTELVNDYYNGGYGSLGSGPGPNLGVSFSGAQVLNEIVFNEGDLVSAPNSIGDVGPGGMFMTVGAGFSDGLSFNYSAPFYSGTVDIFAGPSGTGALLASATLPTTADGAANPSCGTHDFCPDIPFDVTFQGTAKSVQFGGPDLQLVVDDIALGSGSSIVAPTPELPAFASLPIGLLALLLWKFAPALLRGRWRGPAAMPA